MLGVLKSDSGQCSLPPATTRELCEASPLLWGQELEHLKTEVDSLFSSRVSERAELTLKGFDRLCVRLAGAPLSPQRLSSLLHLLLDGGQILSSFLA